MLDSDTRWVILRLLREAGCEHKAVAEMLCIHRATVGRVLAQGTREPPWRRAEVATPYHDRIVELHAIYDGNFAAVHRALAADGIVIGRATVAHFCHRHGISGGEPAANQQRRRLAGRLQDLVWELEAALRPPPPRLGGSTGPQQDD